MKKLSHWSLMLCGCLMLLLTVTARAVTVHDLYKASAIVDHRDSKFVPQAVEQALLKVLIKVSGNAAINSLPQIQSQLPQAEKLLQQYSWQQLPGNTGWELTASFEPNGVRQILKRSGQAIWGRERPRLLIWAAWQTLPSSSSESSLASTQGVVGQESTLGKTFTDIATQRGVPLVLPIMDLTDVANINFDTVWRSMGQSGLATKDLGILQQAARRYPHAAIAIVTMQQTADGWQSNWRLQQAGQNGSWQFQGKDPASIISQGLNQIADQFAGQYAVLSDGAGDRVVTLKVAGVETIRGYTKLLHYLQRLTAVNNVQVTSVQGYTVQYKLKLASGIPVFTKALALDHMLRPVVNSDVPEYYEAGSGDILQYTYQARS